MKDAHLHHPWCNFFMRPREGCKMCEGLFKDYPIKPGESTDDLLKKHFPNVVKR